MTDITYWRNPITGLIEGIKQTGEVLTVQKSLDAPMDVTTKAGFTEHTRTDGSKYWVQDGHGIVESKQWIYNEMLGGAIASEVASGARLSQLHKTFAWCPPMAVLARWRRVFLDFAEMIEQAERDRALIHFEEIIETADATYEKFKDDDDNAVQAAKLKIESRKWLAEKGNVDKFGSKSKVVTEGSVTIVIDTGIRREPIDVTPAVKEIK